MSATTVLASSAGTYVHWGVIQISVANLIVIALMVAIFIAAIFVPFPKGRERR